MPMYTKEGCKTVAADANFAGAQSKYEGKYGECLKRQGGSYTWDKRSLCDPLVPHKVLAAARAGPLAEPVVVSGEPLVDSVPMGVAVGGLAGASESTPSPSSLRSIWPPLPWRWLACCSRCICSPSVCNGVP